MPYLLLIGGTENKSENSRDYIDIVTTSTNTVFIKFSFRMTTKLSRWLKRNLKDNIRNTLDATIEGLLRLCPPIDGKIASSEQKKRLLSSMKALLKKKNTNC